MEFIAVRPVKQGIEAETFIAVRSLVQPLGGCNPNNRKKTEKNSPKFEICGSLRFFRYFSVFSV